MKKVQSDLKEKRILITKISTIIILFFIIVILIWMFLSIKNKDRTRKLEYAGPHESTYSEKSTEAEPDTFSEMDTPVDTSESDTEAVTVEPVIPPSDEEIAGFCADTCFIGDSRTEGIRLYTKIPADFYSVVGNTVKKTLTSNFDDNGTIMQSVMTHDNYKKIYINLGLNEIGWTSTESYKDSYQDIVNQLKEHYPDTKIYCIALIPFSEEASEEYGEFNGNDKVILYNGYLKEIADASGDNVIYIDDYSIFADENGNLNDPTSNDGIHLGTNSCWKLVKYLMDHLNG